jgi:hypothetical protein
MIFGDSLGLGAEVMCTYNSLCVFTGGTEGLFSVSNLVADKAGNLYGTTNEGDAKRFGLAFKVTPQLSV